ncbi:MAG: ice-binding family protein [Candidatus Magasanikbacteria bacterium]|nr:ice-binding family protein [Candidatus Magasanikbacteria bacterium]
MLIALSLAVPTITRAATTPSLGMAASYGVLAGTYTNSSVATTITGDVGFTTGPVAVPAGVRTYYGSGAPYATAHTTDAPTALANLNSQLPCTFDFADGAIDLATDTTHGPIGVYTPGVYCTHGAGAASIGTGGITLSGSGTYIFRINGALTSVDNSVVTLSGASACDVFWTPISSTTLGADTTFAGTIIDNANFITTGANTTWTGRAISLGAGTVTTGDTTTITVPTCAVPLTTQTSSSVATITIVKNVINDNGGTKKIADFPLFVNTTPVVSGNTVVFPENVLYKITESNSTGYAQSFSGDCTAAGTINLIPGSTNYCILTNDDIGKPVIVAPVPPIINVVKVPNPLALPAGPGLVNYTYTLTNIGTVPVTDITMVGDTCFYISLTSGDTNLNKKLEVNETWKYNCSTTLTETHTNTVVATGWANGLSATDIASAHVIVGTPIVPPLINVTKVPNPLTLPVGGGKVTYTEKITNPGTVALSNVRLVDDKCSPMKYISGDTNTDSKLDVNETWKYTCSATLTKTTTNTAIARGEANGLETRDFAIVTVAVASAVPALPDTGASIMENNINKYLAGLFVLLSISAVIYISRKKQLI